MGVDQKKWNSRYKKDAGDYQPSALITSYCHQAATGNALDIACGNGRNSLYLAQKGFKVDAVDISNVAIARLTGRHPNITPLCNDVTRWDIKENFYHLIVNIRFLERQLFEKITNGLVPGGLLIFESFIGKENAPYCLMENELLFAFPELRVLFYEETQTEDTSRFDQRVSMVATKK